MSGQFHSVFIDQITVPPRHRRDIGKLAESIDRLGLLQPIVVYRNGNVLRAGERRLRACKQLGWDHIDCRYVDELNEFELMEIELEENIKRKEMKWQEERSWLAEYHELHCAHDPKWNETKTAENIGMSQQWVSERLIVHEESKSDPELLAEPVFSTACRKAAVRRDRRAKDMRQAVADVVDELLSGVTHETEMHEAEKPKVVINTDFCEWANTYTR